jgi:hypothetical protein
MTSKHVFLGVIEIAGYYFHLGEGLRNLGYKVTYLDLSNHPFKYSDISNQFFSSVAKIHSRYRLSPNLVNRLVWGFFAIFGRFFILLWTLLRCDVFIFSFGKSFFNNHDLPLLKLFGKKVICFIGHGSEARPPYLDGSRLLAGGHPLKYEEYAELVRNMKLNLKRIEKFADYIIASPQTDHFLFREYIPMHTIGIPYDDFSSNVPSMPLNTLVHILHAPSNEIVKGSSMIRDVIRKIKEQGYSFIYKEIAGKPNSVVMEELAKCDFVIDQLYSDTPLSGFACEAAWFGKPAIVGGYQWDSLKKILPSELFQISEICHPDDLEFAIKRLLLNQDHRELIGRQARKFVEIQWNCQAVSEKFSRIIQDDIPKDWWCSPFDHQINVYGGGLQADKAKQLIRLMISNGGIDALGLSDKLDLANQLARFAFQD